MNYKTQKEAIDKIARELGIVQGAISLPKLFLHLQKEDYGYKIPKSSHITQLLTENSSKEKRFVILQKIFGLHRNLSFTVIKEIKPALNKLGFDYSDGAIIETKLRSKPTFNSKVKETIKRYSKSSFLISEAIFRKGEKLSSAYIVIYLIENHLRLFIWKTFGKSNRKLSRHLGNKEKRKITDRKLKESQNKWIPLRRDSNLFYLDIEDLGLIIQNNWIEFQKYFPDQHWINSKIQEVAFIRNRIAHNNSNISDTEKKALELYMEQIFNQIQ